MVPQNLYSPIRQDAVLLKTGPGNPAATAFMAFLKGPEAKAIIERYGYATEDAKYLAFGDAVARNLDGGPAYD